MTECSKDAIGFTGHDRRKVIADFQGGRLTSDAGILLLREVDQQLGLIDSINECLPDPRNPRWIIHQQRSMLAQRIFSIALGYEDLNDQQTMREDPALQTAVDCEPDEEAPLASPPTLCRLENRVNRQTSVMMSKVLVDTFLNSHDQPPKEITLDFDATDDRVHGKQEGRFFQGYYKHYCFLPLYVFCGEHLLCAYLHRAILMQPSIQEPSPNCWSSTFANGGQMSKSRYVETAASAAGDCCDGAKNTVFPTLLGWRGIRFWSEPLVR